MGGVNKVKEWDAARRKLKVAFEAVGITSCEFHYLGCWRDNGLSFAHVDKRRHLRVGELYAVALACAVCHHQLELMPRENMRRVIEDVIQKRICQPQVRH